MATTVNDKGRPANAADETIAAVSALASAIELLAAATHQLPEIREELAQCRARLVTGEEILREKMGGA